MQRSNNMPEGACWHVITQQLHSSQWAYRGSDLRDKTGVGVGVWVMALPLHAVVA
jgi:hypothetical protein